MASDITMDQNDWVTIEAAVVNAKASDLILESAFRKNDGGMFRRALVHNQQDGLTINYNGDYPDGVTVIGARLNLRVEKQSGEVKLPKVAQVGDVAVLRNDVTGGGLDLGDSISMWLCVGETTLHQDTAANWCEIPLGRTVTGSL